MRITPLLRMTTEETSEHNLLPHRKLGRRSIMKIIRSSWAQERFPEAIKDIRGKLKDGLPYTHQDIQELASIPYQRMLENGIEFKKRKKMGFAEYKERYYAQCEANAELILGPKDVSDAEMRKMRTKLRELMVIANHHAMIEGVEGIPVPKPFGPDWTFGSRGEEEEEEEVMPDDF